MSANPEKALLNDKTTATILAPDGSVANLPTEILTGDDARLLRDYRRFLIRHGYKEALYCDRCWERNLARGTEAFVTPERIAIKCRCRLTYFQGQTY